MKELRLEDIIRSHVYLPPYPNQRGFYPVLCKICNDHGNKGLRAGFKFEGDSVGYNCFNCGHKALYNPEDEKISHNMEKILNAFNIPDDEWKQVLFSSMALKDQGYTKSTPKTIYNSIEPKVLDLPEHFYLLSEASDDDKWAEIARFYLEEDRKIDPTVYPFYLSTGKGEKGEEKWKGRVIIPVYKDGNLIYYQGRSFLQNQKKYLSPSSSKDKVLYGFDQLFKNTDAPLYVVEGWFDAFAIDGVAVFGNQLSEEQLQWLNRSNRPKVIIPDRLGDGHLLANKAIQLGWQVSFPDIGNCKDVDAAIKRFGKLYVLKSIIDNTMSGFMAETAIGVYCKGGQDKSKTKNTKARQRKR